VPDRYFGELAGYPVGAPFPTRRAAALAGVHRPLIGGISGTRAQGTDSIVVSGGYEDDEDRGDEIIYTGAGGNDPATGRQIADQSLDQPGNAGLITSKLQGLPVRVVRGARGDRKYAPSSGYRYDGLYRVTEHWASTGKGGFRVIRFRLVRLSGQEAAPFVPDGNWPTGTTKPAVTAGVVQRIVRDTLVSAAVKRIHGHACQVCVFGCACLAVPTPKAPTSAASADRTSARTCPRTSSASAPTTTPCSMPAASTSTATSRFATTTPPLSAR
jgi:putative restriction endonuclease